LIDSILEKSLLVVRAMARRSKKAVSWKRLQKLLLAYAFLFSVVTSHAELRIACALWCFLVFSTTNLRR